MSSTNATAQNWTVGYTQAAQYPSVVVSYMDPMFVQTQQTQGLVRRIHMAWLDVDALPSVVYREWYVTDVPDPTGIYYHSTKSGATAITGAFVVNQNDQ